MNDGIQTFSPEETYAKFILILLMGLISIILLSINLCYKKNKSKEDIFVIEKSFIDLLAFIYIAFFLILDLVKYDHESNSYLTTSILSIYIILDYTLKIWILLEELYTKLYPSYLLDSLIKKSKSYFYELTLFVLVGVYVISKTIDEFNGDINKKYLFSDSIFVGLIITICLVFNVIILSKNKSILIEYSSCILNTLSSKDINNSKLSKNSKRSYYEENNNPNKNYTKSRLILDFINIIFNTIFVIFYIAMLVLSRLNHQEHISNFMKFFTWYFIFYFLMDNTISLAKVYHSDFYYYKLSNSCFKALFICGKNRYRRPLFYSKDTYSENSESICGNLPNLPVILFHDKLKFYIDEVVLIKFEFVLNCINASLAKVFDKYNNILDEDELIEKNEKIGKLGNLVKSAKGKDINEVNNLNDLNVLNDNEPDGNDSPKRQSLLSKQASKQTKSIYKFTRKDFVNDNFAKIFNDQNEVNIELTSYYQNSFEKLIAEKKININTVKTSLFSHLLENGSIISLLDKNCKESEFKSQKNLLIKTFDKQYGFEFVESNFYKNTSFFKKYVKYLRKEKTSFVPSLLGIFKIKVNNFGEINFIITKNNFVEDVPKELFSYWQILRISSNKSIELINTSMETQTLLLLEEPVLIPGKKLSLVEFHTFYEILTKDLEFLMSMHISNFSVIFLYYELGVNQPISNFNNMDFDKPLKGTITHRETREKNNLTNLSGINRLSLIKKLSTIKGVDFSFDNSMKLELSSLQDGKKGFEAVNNNLKSVVFLNFENVFQNFTYFENKSIYQDFKSFMIGFFEEIVFNNN